MALIQKPCRTTSLEENAMKGEKISEAVLEILTFILEKSLPSKETLSLDVNIKSTRQDESTLTWFYIKISTSCEVQTDTFNGNRFEHLLVLIKSLQSLESESHLCVHYPRSDGQSGSSQDNILFVDDELRSIEQIHKPKHTSCYTIYLRVHQELWQMSEECGKIHNFMRLSKVFRPKDEFAFSMKFGEVWSKTNFRAKWCRKVSAEIPEVITDSRKDSFASRQSLNAEPSVSSCPIVTRPHLKSSTELIHDELHLLVIGLCFPCDGYQVEETSHVNVTVFGPNFLPCYGIPYLESVMECLDWGQFGLKMMESTSPVKTDFSRGNFQGILKHKRSSLMDRVYIQVLLVFHSDKSTGTKYDKTMIENAIEDSKSLVVKTMQENIEQVLQPALLKGKTRSMVNRSIKSVCKGVVDVVSMSSSNVFHAKALEIMKVSDTIELGQRLESQLKSLNATRHTGIWAGSLQSYQVTEDQIVPNISISKQIDSLNVHSSLPDQYPDLNHDIVQETMDCGFERDKALPISNETTVSMSNFDDIDVDRIHDDGIEALSNDKLTMSPFNELALGERECFDMERTPVISSLPKCYEGTYPDESRVPDDKSLTLTEDISIVSPFVELAGAEDEHVEINKTQDADLQRKSFFKNNDCKGRSKSEISSSFPKEQIIMTPFNELAFGENEHFAVYRMPDDIEESKDISCFRKLIPDGRNPSTENKIALSFFSEEAITECETIYVDKTPEITQLTKSFKEVSPFQEFASTHDDMTNDIGEDPFIDNSIKQRKLLHTTDESVRKMVLENGLNISTEKEISNDCHSNRKYQRRETHNYFISCSPSTFSQRHNIRNTDNINKCNASRERSITDLQHTAMNDLFNSTESSATREKRFVCRGEELITHEKKLDSSPLLGGSVSLMNEQQVDDIGEDSEDWFNDVLVGIDHWLK